MLLGLPGLETHWLQLKKKIWRTKNAFYIDVPKGFSTVIRYLFQRDTLFKVCKISEILSLERSIAGRFL